MLYAFQPYYAENYAGIINSSLPKDRLQCIHQELYHGCTVRQPMNEIKSGKTFVTRMYSTAAKLRELTFFSTSYLHRDLTGRQLPSDTALHIHTITMVSPPLQELPILLARQVT